MANLIGLVKPLIGVMILAITLGVLGFLCAIFLTVFAGKSLYLVRLKETAAAYHLLKVLMVMALLRGVLHYGEQYCNHYIAFRLLAIIRHKVFSALRKLCPAKLDGKEKGNLISIITSDIELLEVFYAHTISPIFIAVITSLIMVIYIGRIHPLMGALAAFGYGLVGFVIPVLNGKKGKTSGMAFRTAFGDMSSFVLGSLRGLDETIQYGEGTRRRKAMDERSRKLAGMQKTLSDLMGRQRAFTNLAILLTAFGMFTLSLNLFYSGDIDAEGVLIGTIAMMGSFGPVVALSNLSNNLSQTFASGERVLSLLEEEPLIRDIPGERDIRENFSGAEARAVDFSYDGKEQILENYSLAIPSGQIVALHGPSGSGKSTLLKLFMRFYDADSGEIRISGQEIKSLPTTSLRDAECYVTQETHLFCGSIADNIALGDKNIPREKIVQAARMASIHDFIMTLREGYDTKVGELGDTLSGGERQRIGIARAFLSEAPFMLLDEPTSNLDVLNEGIILKSIREESRDRTVVIVSHRDSTMNIADIVYDVGGNRVS